MDLSYGAAAEEFRGEVRAFLSANWQPGERRGNELKDYVRDFRRQGVEAGYLYRAVPRAYGGSEQPVDVIRAQVIREEFGRARAPMELGGNGVNMTVPTLLERGTQEQKDLFIRKTIEGEYIWGQGYSEPGSGSDLASVRTKAELSPDGTKWIVNGQKIWTSQGMQSTHMFMLVRTEPDAPKHDGITYLLMDLNQPGVTRRPIRQMTGEQGNDTFCEFFFDNAETPVSWQVGERGQGWYVSRTTLKHERASIGSADGLGNQFRKLVELAKEMGRLDDPLVRDRLGEIEGRVLSHRYSSFRLFSCAAAGDDPGAIQLMMKLLLTEIGHDMALLAQDLIGEEGLTEPAGAGARGYRGPRGPNKWLDQIMGSLGNSIAGGTSNIQRNIIGERGLGLPRDSAA
ncbi:acyl-CoA dehydrogenase family protein [Novosphingobium sp.]|jgi:alkylation response protein AidB-like acyl-CoA dehydrogenase|uniref:acyl-CoA dehydrogenase family protein n=1 Tax=Novosphingobium sp. TaxID=1874826 RepID=UPI001ED79EF9|nr:acyl-CoA dehydrogenase family protein [Novosphingobium sp.]MBK6799945.1 acyl-CoA dehydrogenase family protein [Novosphingobium sp.]MBK9011039.1 acyl-CoA dehydrogenase family protein [Novosphingobium sp.]